MVVFMYIFLVNRSRIRSLSSRSEKKTLFRNGFVDRKYSCGMLSGFNDNALYSKKDNQGFKDLRLPFDLRSALCGMFFPHDW